jgi:hypothetical protein
MYRNAVSAFLLGWFLSVLVGCSGNGLVQVSGEVTVDGNPLKNGTISFFSDTGEKSGPTAGAAIKDGKYSAAVASGRKRVEIRGYQTVGQTRVAGPESPLIDIVKDILPDQYNAKSELTCEIAASASPQNFALKSGGKISAQR